MDLKSGIRVSECLFAFLILIINKMIDIYVTITKAKQTLNILKALNSVKWGKQKNLFPHLKLSFVPHFEYANTIWSPIILNTNN